MNNVTYLHPDGAPGNGRPPAPPASRVRLRPDRCEVVCAAGGGCGTFDRRGERLLDVGQIANARKSSPTYRGAAEGFALTTGYDETADRYQGLAIPHVDTFGECDRKVLTTVPTATE